jgi:hypothetical protein
VSKSKESLTKPPGPGALCRWQQSANNRRQDSARAHRWMARGPSRSSQSTRSITRTLGWACLASVLAVLAANGIVWHTLCATAVRAPLRKTFFSRPIGKRARMTTASWAPSPLKHRAAAGRALQKFAQRHHDSICPVPARRPSIEKMNIAITLPDRTYALIVAPCFALQAVLSFALLDFTSPYSPPPPM